MRIALAALALALPAPAWALSCAFGPTQSLPADGATDVPTNAVLRVMVAGAEIDDATLTELTAGDVQVELDVHDQGNMHLLSITPAQELAPDTSYTLTVGEDFGWTATFTTGAGPDEQAPAQPVIDDASRDRSRSEWGRTDHLVIDLQPASEPVLYRVDVFGDGVNSVHPVYVLPWTQVGELPSLSVGEGLCGTSVELEGSVDFEVTAIDMADNASAPTEQGTVSGCSSLATPASLGVLGLALGLVGLRRRRRA